MHNIWYRCVHWLARLLATLFLRLEVTGREHVPEQGPFILATNHLHILDPPLAYAAIPYRHVTVLAAEKWEESFPIGPFLKSMGAIFVQRGEVDRQALNAVLAVLEAGGIVGMAPEGTRSPVGTMQRGKPGLAYLATKAGVPILPLGISGHLHMFEDWRRLRRPRVRVRIGPLIALPPVTGRQKNQQLEALTEEIMVALARLVDPELRGVYAVAVAAGEETD